VKLLTFATAGAIALFAGQVAFAQDDSATLTIAPEHEKIIRDYVVKEHVRPATVDETFAVGATVPDTVDIAPVPEQIYTTAPEVKKYRYFYWNNRVVFVDPDSRRVVDIIN
jgi:hypothetical protein